MSVLLLRLAGPMQSWGTRSRFSNRDTGLEPSRSGVVGLLCAALGRPRDASLEDFAPSRLKMAVRVNREGRLMRDYHTAQDVLRASGKTTQDTVLSERFYLADADFLVGLQGDSTFLNALAAALEAPVWQVCLGRKAFVPSLPVGEGVHNGELIEVLKTQKWRRRCRGERPESNGPRESEGFKLRYVVETEFGIGEPRQDVPLSFVSRDRRFAIRHVKTESHPLSADQILDPDQEFPHVPQQTDPEHA
ncbi:MAG: CRISPR-associated protein Cas5e family [Gemmataceae bacterium]|nr:CRISPR-associated protein Cas5e family [Gemmataceae bacterium]